jgi:hypothetical protein
LPANDGFEDREGHQAPFTLLIADCGSRIADRRRENAERPTSNEERRIKAEKERCARLFELLNRADNLIEVRPVAGFEFGVYEFSIGANLESTAARRNKSERLNALAEFENLGRQTDSLGRIISNHAVFDRYLGFHVELLSTKPRYRDSETGSRISRQ